MEDRENPGQKMMNKKITVISLLFLFVSLRLSAETIVLKTGKTIESKILEKTDKNIKVDISGIPITYYLDEIKTIDGLTPANATVKSQLSQTTAAEIPSNGTDINRIRKILKHLGYPEYTWPDIERELTAFLVKIDFLRLKQEAEYAKANPEQLKQFVIKIGSLIKQKGQMDVASYSKVLIKLLVSSLGDEDIFRIIDTSPISQEEKEKSKRTLIYCSAISQLGSVILNMVEINGNVVIAPKHVFNCVPLNDGKIVFVDFTNHVFEIVDVNQYYKREGKYMVLKEEYRINPKRIYEIKMQWARGKQPDTLKEIFNCLYSYIYITDNYTATPGIYVNRASMYSNRGEYDKAISNCNYALKLNSNFAEAYYNRGFAYREKGNLGQAIIDFSKAVENNPSDAETYNERGIAYMWSSDIDKGNLDKAIVDFGKAIEIDPSNARPYNNRGFCYFLKKDYDKAWDDVAKAEELGYKVHEGFLADLKKASGRDK